MQKQLSCIPATIKLQKKLFKLIIHTIQVNYADLPP